MKTRVLITGAGGLAGKTLHEALEKQGNYEVLALDKKALDITQGEKVMEAVQGFRPEYVVNCAAFTQVDRAETQRRQAYAVNVEGVRHLAQASVATGAVLIHLSTDYVFDGEKKAPYSENDLTNPLNYYGQTKLEGEQEILRLSERFFIIRPAWIYGKYGRNFYHLLVELAQKNKELRFINDQTGSPTYAGDLADFIRFLTDERIEDFGIYHFSNEGETTRYGQARLMLRLLGFENPVKPVPHTYFNAPAKRPAYSVLSKEKVKKKFGYPVPHWKESMEKFIKSIR